MHVAVADVCRTFCWTFSQVLSIIILPSLPGVFLPMLAIVLRASSARRTRKRARRLAALTRCFQREKFERERLRD